MKRLTCLFFVVLTSLMVVTYGNTENEILKYTCLTFASGLIGFSWSLVGNYSERLEK